MRENASVFDQIEDSEVLEMPAKCWLCRSDLSAELLSLHAPPSLGKLFLFIFTTYTTGGTDPPLSSMEVPALAPHRNGLACRGSMTRATPPLFRTIPVRPVSTSSTRLATRTTRGSDPAHPKHYHDKPPFPKPSLLHDLTGDFTALGQHRWCPASATDREPGTGIRN